MSGKKRRKASNSFRQAVQNTHELGEDAYCSGLRALTDSDSRRIVSGKVPILGSVNLDAALRQHYPNDARWDYGIGIQKGKPWTLWVEVHPADTSNVDEVLKKLTWLKDWLAHSAQPLHALIPIAQPKFTKTSMPDNPLLKVPPASRGNRTHAPHAVPLAKRGEP
jgi:hypothetical protein